MKVYYKILGLIFFAVLLLGCNKNAISVENSEIDINTDRSYIRFDSGISTRGALFMKDYLDADFNVLGYQYPGTWEAASIMATPNVFQSTPQLVTHSNGIYTYSPIKAWTGNTYSFFGYYPSDSKYINIFDDGKTVKQGIPYITYTVPPSEDPSDLIDIMTASVINTNIDVSPDVRLVMNHRLSAIDIGARNYYVQKITNGETEESRIVTIEITGLEMQVNTYTSAKIYLDGTTATTGTGSQTLKYQMVDSATDIAPNSTDDTTLRLLTTDTGENATSLILVPQSNFLEGTLSLKYKKKYKNDNEEYVYIGNEESVNVDLKTLERSLVEGRRYTIEFTFTSDAVSINISVVDEWDEINKDDLKHEFE